MKSFLLILALCNPSGDSCRPDPSATVYEYDRRVDCVRAKAHFIETFQVEAYCTGADPEIV